MRGLDDRPFYGNGTRWQNVHGKRAHWWQFSYDTSSPAGRAGQAIARLMYIGVAIWLLVILLQHG